MKNQANTLNRDQFIALLNTLIQGWGGDIENLTVEPSATPNSYVTERDALARKTRDFLRDEFGV